MPDILYQWVLLAAVFMPLERLLPHDRSQRALRAGAGGDLVYLVVNSLLIGVVLGGIGVALVSLRAMVMPQVMLDAVASAPFWLQLCGVVVLGDFGFYLAHRAFHQIPVLWRFHAVHHSIEHLDWLAAHRVHALDQISTKTASLLPIILLGFQVEAVAIWGLLYGWHSLLLHANIRLPLGPLEGIIASPHFHRWHHAHDEEGRDKNFAGQLAFLDYLFGTAHRPEGRFPNAYGTDEPLPSGWLAQFAAPFKRR